ncbi:MULTISPECIES: aspartate/glutamate racemase family protein [Marivita]|uniref:Aspartate/glutamate racemase family protein n=1 Tax=Marivita cryptomonadis TaxID=505252 RepID=A0A9Q2S5S5_9RHOB|nr:MULTISPECIES: aspartate/glutamate racemase family protein [Marivita]MCR9167355.1 aspartate/glutamate racemase family protein [Paracoccaceae bacterium]MBM2322474.1 aspartate/glutamate racemase family protein [Marivita cryptomonadis]MBM2332056.1 aspartate/glutamate racemase family protein [Marivita cryptomonadis]MBM2341640.1 aspartate/glutamate racemase family protein [Marivita cryptomonadis]MBM2346304.1 aspartate/glutamate racemase family protein [Marivita cryptomonadis]
MKAQGGKAIYGAAVGILMLEARFPRIPGDMGNATSWDFPVHYKIVRGASPDKVVRRNAEGLLPDFITAAQELVADGVDGITTNCGFLSVFQHDIAKAVGVPVATSSLMQTAMVNALLPPGKKAGILTISGSSLTPAHLIAAGVPLDTPIGSTEGGREFTRAILGNEPELDVAAAEADNVDAARQLVASNPDVGALVLECTNMGPYAPAIRVATGLPVFSILNFVTWFQTGLSPRVF